MLLDASCTPADIAYPTDLGLLNEAREKLEHIINILHALHRGKRKSHVHTVKRVGRVIYPLPNNGSQKRKKYAKLWANNLDMLPVI